MDPRAKPEDDSVWCGVFSGYQTFAGGMISLLASISFSIDHSHSNGGRLYVSAESRVSAKTWFSDANSRSRSNNEFISTRRAESGVLFPN